MERIGQTATDKQLTLGSLFDGIGNGMSQPCADFVIRGIVREKTQEEEK